MKALRRFFFYLFLAVYLVAAPVAILYALGYMWAPGSERGLVKSGLIALSSTPDDAAIFLGASRYTRRTPALIRDLLPGDYTLRLSHPGHDDLALNVRVEPERATVLDRIVLLPAARVPRALADGPWSELIATPGGRLILLHRGDAIFAFDTRDPEEPPRDISRFFTARPDEFAWDRRDREILFARYGERVHRVDLDNGAIYPDIAPPARRIAVYRKKLLIEDQAGHLVRIGRDGVAESDAPPVPPDLFARGARPLAPNADETRWLYTEGVAVGYVERVEKDDGEYAWSNHVLHAHAAPVARAEWAHDDSHVLFSSEGALWLLALSRGGGGPPRFVCRIGVGGAFHFDERSGRVLLLDSDSRFAALTLAPPRSLIPLHELREEAP